MLEVTGRAGAHRVTWKPAADVSGEVRVQLRVDRDRIKTRAATVRQAALTVDVAEEVSRAERHEQGLELADVQQRSGDETNDAEARPLIRASRSDTCRSSVSTGSRSPVARQSRGSSTARGAVWSCRLRCATSTSTDWRRWDSSPGTRSRLPQRRVVANAWSRGASGRRLSALRCARGALQHTAREPGALLAALRGSHADPPVARLGCAVHTPLRDPRVRARTQPLKHAAAGVEDPQMARTITGVLLLLWGLAILVSAFFRDVDGTGAYATGQKLSWVFAVALVALGARAIIKGRAARR